MMAGCTHLNIGCLHQLMCTYICLGSLGCLYTLWVLVVIPLPVAAARGVSAHFGCYFSIPLPVAAASRDASL